MSTDPATPLPAPSQEPETRFALAKKGVTNLGGSPRVIRTDSAREAVQLRAEGWTDTPNVGEGLAADVAPVVTGEPQVQLPASAGPSTPSTQHVALAGDETDDAPLPMSSDPDPDPDTAPAASDNSSRSKRSRS